MYIHIMILYLMGDEGMSSDLFAPISAIGGGFFGGLLLGFALKKVVRLIAIVVGLFIAGLAYLQYQQVASIDWNRIEVLAAEALGIMSDYLSNNQEAAIVAMSNLGLPLTGSISAGFAVGFMK